MMVMKQNEHEDTDLTFFCLLEAAKSSQEALPLLSADSADKKHTYWLEKDVDAHCQSPDLS